jgi:hypothetical protein
MKSTQVLTTLFFAAVASAIVTDAAVPRNVFISNQQFMLRKTGKPIVMSGPNVVVKGPPYLPSVSGSTICNDVVNDACTKTGTCTSCQTFNEADVKHMQSLGWDTIRLGIIWAGGQPVNADTLDPDFVQRLHAVLNLTDAHGINVILDMHGTCGLSLSCPPRSRSVCRQASCAAVAVFVCIAL